MGYSLGLLSGPHDPSTQRVPVAPLPSPRTPTRRSRRSNQRLRIWGDVANHYVVSIQQPEWATGFDDVKDMAITSRKRILNLMVNDKIAVAGFHLPFPAVRFVERSGTSYRWVPAC